MQQIKRTYYVYITRLCLFNSVFELKMVHFYLAKLIEVQHFPLYVREPDLGSLQLPELCDLIQEVKLNSCEGLCDQDRRG